MPRFLRTFAPLLILACTVLIATAQPPKATTSKEPALGTYHWPNGTAGVDQFATWLNRDTVWALDFVGTESWDSIGWPVWWLENWSKWVHAKPNRRLILSIPILPGPLDYSGPTDGQKGRGVTVSLEQGAKGEYNQHFKDLAENLVRYKMTSTIIRPAWEFNGNWYTWQAKGKTKAFIEYWQQIVKTMRAVPGCEKLEFCWNPTSGYQQFPADEAWPGDDYVDYVGVDVYDETWLEGTYPWPANSTPEEIEKRRQKAWDGFIMNDHRGLTFYTQFAKDHHKPLAIPEWGVCESKHNHGGLDNAYFIKKMHEFIMNPDNNVAFHCYFDVNTPSINHQLSPGPAKSDQPEGTHHPNSSKLFRELFSK